MQTDERRTRIRKLIVLVVAIFCLFFIYYVVSHGRLSVEGLPEKSTITIQQGIRFDEKAKTIGSTSVQKSGVYVVKIVSGSDVSSYKVRVPGFLGEVKVSAAKTPRLRAKKIANNVLDLNIYTNQTVYSMQKLSTTGTVSVHTITSSVPFSQDTTTSTPSYFVPFSIVGDQFFGYTQKTANSDELVLASFNPATNKISNLPGAKNIGSTPDDLPQVTTNQQGGFVVITSSGSFSYYKSLAENPRTINIKTEDYSSSGSTPIVDLVGETLFVYKGASFDATELNNENTNAKKPAKISKEFTVALYNLSTGEKKSAISGELTAAASSIRVSPDKSKFILNTAAKNTAVYSSDGGIITSLAIDTENGQTEWLDTSHIVYLDANEGLLGVDINTEATHTLFSGKTLTYNSFTRRGQKIYLVGYTKGTDESQTSGNFSLGRVLYSIDTTQTTDNNTVIDATPYITGDYVLDNMDGKLYFLPVAIGPDDILFTNETVLRSAVSKRISDAKDVLKANGVDTKSLVVSRDLVLPTVNTSF